MTTIRILFLLLTAVVSQAQTPESKVSLADTQQRTLTCAKIGQRYELLVSLRFSAPVRLDLSVGDEGDNTDSTMAFAKILSEMKPVGLDYRFTVYRGETMTQFD